MYLVYKICKQIEEKSCQEASKIEFFELNYGDSKNEMQIMSAEPPQIEKKPQTLTGATFLLAEKCPVEGG